MDCHALLRVRLNNTTLADYFLIIIKDGQSDFDTLHIPDHHYEAGDLYLIKLEAQCSFFTELHVITLRAFHDFDHPAYKIDHVIHTLSSSILNRQYSVLESC